MAGYLTSSLRHDVDPRARSRGESYFFAGAVRKISGDAWSVEARVQGTRLYEVDIFRLENGFESSCSCPRFEDSFEMCKHIWATLLAAEKAGYLRGDDDNRWLRNSLHHRNGAGAPQRHPDWRYQLEQFARFSHPVITNDRSTRERQLLYLVQARETVDRQRLTIIVGQRDRRKDGSWGIIKQQRIRVQDVGSLPDETDRRLLALLLGAGHTSDYGYSSLTSPPLEFSLREEAYDVLLPLMCATERCFLQRGWQSEPQGPLRWDDAPPWEFALRARLDKNQNRFQLSGVLRRNGEEMDARATELVTPGLLIQNGRIARLRDPGAARSIGLVREWNGLTVPRREMDDFLDRYLQLWPRPALELPDEIKFAEVTPRPKPMLSIKKSEPHPWLPPRLIGKLAFEYDGEIIPFDADSPGVFRKETRVFLRRDRSREQELSERLQQLGFRKADVAQGEHFTLVPGLLPKAVRALVGENWRVEAEGQLFRAAAGIRVEVNSGVDWFELSGGGDFGGISVPLPRLLSAIRRREHTVSLGDGTIGILPEDWLERYGMLAELGTTAQERVRFARPQALLLDALLATAPQVTTDETFERLRNELNNFSGVTCEDAPPTLTGELRDYQREGLGWMSFLRRCGFGGCLADDMGLGKTVQALALLESRRAARAQLGTSPGKKPRPSLVVVPRSLLFHWNSEAQRFAPELRVLIHAGPGRRKPGAHFAQYDLIVTTYGTLRRDVLHFKDQRFDYCILDEAQAIKNSSTLSAKAARLLRAEHRLAMSGTPVENHLGELWSLFEFLNPGMLGTSTLFGRTTRNPDDATRQVLSKALRPFILRRTKEQVARELPERMEQTIYCDLEPQERRLYDELRDYYRARLLKTGRDDMARLKFQALEALLRLRQAACHPGLIDKTKKANPGAKIDTLLAQLEQVLDEGHKALVFSQFTSLLAILRERLDRAAVRYVYLDGRTRDRQSRVEDFQNTPDLKLFLVSLKAGGVGLNLHAADYVYLLDPWWNPAVEAQAIDRAHRIGQTRPVFAYRLIARDTVEEKVLELQRTKRDLADAIVTGSNSLLQSLTREDLQLLLS